MDNYGYIYADPAEAKVMAVCDGCGGEIYEGEYVYAMPDGKITHVREECISLAVLARYVPVEEALRN